MASRTPQQGIFQTPAPRLLLIRTPFLLVRFVVFSLLIYMSLSALVFAAWNVGASRAAGAYVSGAASFLLFNAITIPPCIAMALAGPTVLSLSTSSVGFECAWTGIFTVLQIAASIFVTLSGPPRYCDERVPLSICASITILVPISWLAATLLLGYFIALVAICVAHLREYPYLWSTPIYEIAWFDDGEKRSEVPQLPPLDTSPIDLSLTPLPQATNEDVENRLPPTVLASALAPALAPTMPDPNPGREKPLPSSPSSNVWWGRMFAGRAGRDHPFAIRRPGGRVQGHYYPSYYSSTDPRRNNSRNNRGSSIVRSPTIKVPAAAATLPAYRAQPWREWQRQQARRDGPTQFAVSEDQDPPDESAPGISFEVDVVLNEDEPIPAGDRSQWVRATQAPGPYIPPPPTSWRGGRRR